MMCPLASTAAQSVVGPLLSVAQPPSRVDAPPEVVILPEPLFVKAIVAPTLRVIPFIVTFVALPPLELVVMLDAPALRVVDAND